MNQKDNTTPHTASVYDENIKKTLPFYDLFHKETLDLIFTIHENPKSWLDTGCGTGRLIQQALARFPDTSFILTDPSENMLVEAKKNLLNFPAEKIQFLNTTGSANISNNLHQSIQVVTAIQCHHYLKGETRKKATKKCFDLLSIEGVYITFENIRPTSKRGIEIALKNWKRYQSNQGKSKEEVENHGKRFDQAYFPITILEHLNLLKETGFHTVELFWASRMQAGFYGIK